jgi:DNA-binding Lrp family transcriptional regulator
MFFGEHMEKEPLDRIDREIVAALTNNARLSNKEIAARVGLAPSSCHERVKRLITTGVLRGFHADVDPAALGLGLEAMISVRMREHSREKYDHFRAHLLSLPEVAGIYHTSGENDFLVHVRVRDAHHLRDFAIDSIITREEVGHIETGLIFEHVRARATATAG